MDAVALVATLNLVITTSSTLGEAEGKLPASGLRAAVTPYSSKVSLWARSAASPQSLKLGQFQLAQAGHIGSPRHLCDERRGGLEQTSVGVAKARVPAVRELALTPVSFDEA